MHTLQQTLAETTRSLHQRIENNPFMHAFLRKEPMEQPYRWLLNKLYPFTVGAETKLSGLIDEREGFDIPKRLRAHLLHNDLVELGITAESSDSSLFDTIDTLPKAIGLLYVMEGSRKGGAFLSSHLLKSQLPLPMSYLIGYGETTDTRWEEFCTLLQRYANTPLQEEIVSGAISAFEILERIFHDQ
ncbi:MAG TPA: biliverdin-producing heme oxygenase [Sulfuricurvum sp.]|nr:biliverdin-producing heme oxygenase [Sulfuricurvum sp.]